MYKFINRSLIFLMTIMMVCWLHSI